MKKTVIIIPTRLGAKRFPGKPLAKINNLPMIVHVFERAKDSNVGEVLVATPDHEIVDVISENGGKAILTNGNHLSGSDRVYEAYLKVYKNQKNNVDLIINLQGDMPNINSSAIKNLEKLMRNNNCDIGTLACAIKDKNEILDPNIVKIETDEDLKENKFLLAKDFFRIKKHLKNEKIYHHIGIYAFTSVALTKYVKLTRSGLEIERNLEQMRAIQNEMKIKVALSNTAPLGVDTKEDFKKVIKEMN